MLERPPKPSHPHLKLLYHETIEILEEAAAIRLRHSDAQLTWSPKPGQWSIVQCIGHLNATADLYLPRIRAATARAAGSPPDAPYRPSLIARKFIDALRPGTRFKLKTFAAFQPESQPDPATTFEAFQTKYTTLLALMGEASEVNINREKMASPATKLLRFSLGEAIELLVVHAKRHLLQANRLSEHPAFPAEEIA